MLADVLNVALDQKPEKIVDLATLTGACVVALGTEVAGLMTNDQPWCDAVAAAARRVGEPVWQLPMYPEIYDDMIKSEVADIKNVGEGRWGGAITAAKFLERFVGQTPWTHMDIAGPAFRDKPKPWSDGGASGIYVRTLVELARGWLIAGRIRSGVHARRTDSIESAPSDGWNSGHALDLRTFGRRDRLARAGTVDARNRGAGPQPLVRPAAARAAVAPRHHADALGAGRLTEILYQLFTEQAGPAADVHVIPTLGQHVPHTPEENRRMFGSIPNERIHAHDWRERLRARSAKSRPPKFAPPRAAWPIGRSRSCSTAC